MKKFAILFSLLILTIGGVAQSSRSVVPPAAGYCWYAAGSTFLSINNTASAGPSFSSLPAVGIYGLNGSTYFPLACDASGNLILSGGSGTVTSVALKSATPNLFSGTAGTAVTTSGFLDPDAQLLTQSANCLVGGPASGAAATPTCRPLVNADLPAVPTSKAFFPQTISAGPYMNFYEQFFGPSNFTAQSVGAPSGNSCTQNLSTFSDANHPAFLLASSGTGGAGTGQSCVISVLATQLLFNANTVPAWTFEVDVQPSVLPATTAARYQAGFAGAGGTNVDPITTGIIFHLTDANTNKNNWYCKFGNNAETDSTVTAVTGSWTRLSIASDGTLVHWYINGTEVCGTGVAIASMPSGKLFGLVTSVAGTATAVNFADAYFIVQRNTAR